MNWINSVLLQDIFPCSFGSCLTYIEAQRTGWKGPQGVIYIIPLPQGRITCPLCSASSLKTSNKCNFTASLDNLFQCQLPLPLESFPNAWAGCPLLPLMNISSGPICDGKEQEFVTSTPPALTYLKTLCLLQTKQASDSRGPCFQDLWSSLLSSGQWPTSFLNCSTKIGWSLPAEAFPARCGWKWFCVAVRVRDRTPGYYIPSAFVNLL